MKGHYHATEQATDYDSLLNNRDRVAFTLWNELGAMSAYRAARQALLQAVEDGYCKGGALLAYDDGYHYDVLTKRYMTKAGPTGFEASYHKEKIEELTTKIYAHIAERKGA